MLHRVEVAAPGIATGGLPAGDHGAGGFVELAAGLDVEAEAGQAALHVAALVAIEAELVLGEWARLFRESGGIDADTCDEGAFRGRWAVLKRGDTGQRDRFEGAVGIVGEIGVELFGLAGVLDRAPELEFDVGSRTRGDSRRIGRAAGNHGRLIEIDGAGQVGVAPRQLTLAGLVLDLGADLGHRLLDLHARRSNVGHQRAGERAVGADLAVERGLSRAGGKCDQRAFAGFHFGKPGLNVDAAGGLGGADFRGERVVAAGVEKHQLDLGVAHGLFECDIDVDGSAELDVHFGFEVGIDGQQIVGAVHRDAVAGIEEQRDIGAFGLLAEVQQPLRHLVAGEV